MNLSIAAGLVGCVLIMVLGWPASAQEDGVRLVPAEPLAANPVSLPEAVEFHIVAGYGAEVVGGRSVVTISVDRPDTAVALVLTSYESILWGLEATPGTRIAAVFVDSHERHPHVETALDVPVRQLDLPRSYRTDDARFGELLRTLQREFQMDRAASALSANAIPNEVTISRVEGSNPHLDPDWPQPTAADPTARFSLLRLDGQLHEWTLTGPVDGPPGVAFPLNAPVRSPDGARIFQFFDHAMVVRDLETDEIRSVPIPPGMVSVSWPQGIAYDTRRDEIALVTTGGGGEGFLYRFDAEAEQWIDASSIGRDDKLYTLAYDPIDDHYVGMGFRRGLTVIAIPAGSGGRPNVIQAADLVGPSRVLGVNARVSEVDIGRLIWLVPTERGYVFLGTRSVPGSPGGRSERGSQGERAIQAIWWMPRGSSAAALTYREETDAQ